MAWARLRGILNCIWNGHAQVPDGFGQPAGIRRRFSLLGEVQEERDAGGQEVQDPVADQAFRRDPGYGPPSRRPGMIQQASGMGRSSLAGSSERAGFIVGP
jgi:hypothetical protein